MDKGIVLVSSVSIMRDNKVLMIKEDRPYTVNKWNFPSGRTEKNEDIKVAAVREVQEETSLDVNLEYSTGVYNFMSDSNDQVILFHFIGSNKSGKIKLVEEGIIDYAWLSLSEIVEMSDETYRNAGVIKQITGNIIHNNFYPISLFNKQLLSR